MNNVAKIFQKGRSQAVRLPAAYRFEGKEVFFHALEQANVPDDFLDTDERKQAIQDRDPFKVWAG